MLDGQFFRGWEKNKIKKFYFHAGILAYLTNYLNSRIFRT